MPLSFLAKTDHAKNEKPPALERWAEELEVTPPSIPITENEFSHKFKLCIYSIRNRGITSCLLKSRLAGTKKLRADRKATQSKGITTNYLAH